MSRNTVLITIRPLLWFFLVGPIGVKPFSPASVTTTTTTSLSAPDYKQHVICRCDTHLSVAYAAAAGDNKQQAVLSESSTRTSKKQKQPNYETITSSSTKSNRTFEENLTALAEFKKEFNTSNVPGQYRWERESEYYVLSRWVYNIRKLQSGLTTEQRAALDELEFAWHSADRKHKDRKWAQMFEQLLSYTTLNGHFHVPYRSEEDRKLAHWATIQRGLYRKGILQKDRVAALESIGFPWRLRKAARPPNDTQWMERYEELKEFKKEYNHVNVPATRNAKNRYKSLGEWLFTQRQLFSRGELRKDREEMLNEIGVVWNFRDIWDASWQALYDELKSYYHENNRSAIAIVDNQRLRGWASQQRRANRTGKLDPKRKAKLDEIGFDWNPQHIFPMRE